jgi:valyl-tRNA synthetase
MATNAASYNPIGEKTGPVSGYPPPLSEDTKAAIAESAKSSTTGDHVPSQDAGGEKNAEGGKEGMRTLQS